eukprot:TRINITY_DN1019_c3_g2_i1.p1 TRINITY_DN1019_c3_g2~~TRINITY_DN1019_c3_g2_i1.p1  ORF type:complete len:445 (+),score=75.43 TRINITY_DN1019_c3_g2_i1:65-1336(+)
MKILQFIAFTSFLSVILANSDTAIMADQYTSHDRVNMVPLPVTEDATKFGWGPSMARVQNGFVIVWVSETADSMGKRKLLARSFSEYNWPDDKVVTICEIYPRAPPRIAGAFNTNTLLVTYQLKTQVVTAQLFVDTLGQLTLLESGCGVDEVSPYYFHQHAAAASDDGRFIAVTTMVLGSLMSKGMSVYFPGTSTYWPRPVIEQYSYQTQPDIAFLNNGNILLVWQDFASRTISGIVVTPEGVRVSEIFRADEGNMPGGVWFPVIVTKHTSSGFFILWKEDAELLSNKDPVPGIWIREFNGSGGFQAENPTAVRIVRSEHSTGNGFVPAAVIREDDTAIVIAYLEGTILKVDEFSLRHDGSFGVRRAGFFDNVVPEPGFSNVTKPSIIQVGPMGVGHFGFSLVCSFSNSLPMTHYTDFDSFPR